MLKMYVSNSSQMERRRTKWFTITHSGGWTTTFFFTGARPSPNSPDNINCLWPEGIAAEVGYCRRSLNPQTKSQKGAEVSSKKTYSSQHKPSARQWGNSLVQHAFWQQPIVSSGQHTPGSVLQHLVVPPPQQKPNSHCQSSGRHAWVCASSFWLPPRAGTGSTPPDLAPSSATPPGESKSVGGELHFSYFLSSFLFRIRFQDGSVDLLSLSLGGFVGAGISRWHGRLREQLTFPLYVHGTLDSAR